MSARTWEDVAAEEGWGLFDCSDRIEIERDDDANRFSCDLEATIHVYSHAVRDPDGPHYAALVEWKRADPDNYAKVKAWIFNELP